MITFLKSNNSSLKLPIVVFVFAQVSSKHNKPFRVAFLIKRWVLFRYVGIKAHNWDKSFNDGTKTA